MWGGIIEEERKEGRIMGKGREGERKGEGEV